MFVALPAEAQEAILGGAKGDGLEREWASITGRVFDPNPPDAAGYYYVGALAETTRREVAQVVEDLLQQPRIEGERG